MRSQTLTAFIEELEKAAAPALQGFKQPGLRGILPAWAMPKREQRTVNQLTSNVMNAPSPLITTKPGRPASTIQMPKVAATLDELQEAYRRIAPIRTKAKPLTVKAIDDFRRSGVSPGSVALRANTGAIGPRTIPTATMANKMEAAIPDRVAQVKDVYKAMPRVYRPKGKEIEERVQHSIMEPVGQARTTGGGGHILMPAGGVVPVLKRLGMPLQTPGGQRAANIMTGIHEGFERQVKKPVPYVTHLSPEVMLKEHNLVAGLTGPESDRGKRIFKRMRAPLEAPMQETAMKALYGEKAAPYAQYGEGAKIPKAMRKDMMRRWPVAQKALDERDKDTIRQAVKAKREGERAARKAAKE